MCVSLKDLCLFLRLQQLDEENSELRSCVPCLRANIERLEEVRAIVSRLLVFLLSHNTPPHPHLLVLFFLIVQEKRKLEDETDAMSDRLQEETESRRKMGDKLSHERHQSQKEKECTQEVQLVSLCTK